MKAYIRLSYRACLFIGMLCAVKMVQAQSPVAEFAANVTAGCPPLIVSFTNLTSGTIDSVFWDFGNGSTSKRLSPSTTYFDPGKYTVRLTVYSGGSTDVEVKQQYIEVYETPQSSFLANPLSGCFPLPVTFLNNSNTGTDITPSYYWDFGDGTSSTEFAPQHTYTNGGTFDIALKVTSSKGCTNTSAKPDYIRIENGVIADFVVTNIDVCKTPASVNFRNKSVSNGVMTYVWNFGDGTPNSTEENPNHKYAVQGIYTVLLKATTNAGCTDTMSMEIVIGFPESSFTAPDTLCTGQPATFVNTSTPRPVTCTWTFSNGVISRDLNPTLSFNTPGTYTVKLVNEFSASCKDSVGPVTFRVFSGPTVDFSTADTANCTAPYTVQFENKSIGANSFRWDFGDGTTSTVREPSHTYTRTGSFTVTLTAYNISGCKEVMVIPNYILIQPVQIIGITNLPDSGCVPHTIYPKVVLNINARIKSIRWDFGDGSSSTAVNPAHQYTIEGVYNISVEVTTFDGCIDKFTRYGAVHVGHKPNADFITDPPEICASESVMLINTSTNGPIHHLSWNFGPLGNASADSIYLYEPSDTGYIELSLVAYNYGCADTVTYDSILYVRPPTAKFTYLTGCDDRLTVDFESNSQGETTREWRFGDGATDTGTVVSHTYAAAGNYDVQIIVRNDECADTTTKTVTIINEVGLLSLPGFVFCRNTLVNCDILSVNAANVSSTKWDFGDGKTVVVNGTQTSHSYFESGTYLITAIMTDINGCEYAYQAPDSVTIYGPVAKLNSDDPGVCKNSIVTFNDLSTTDGVHNIVEWTWDYGNGQRTTYTVPPFQSLYKDTGFYTVKIIVKDSYGCIDSARKLNYVQVTFPYPGYLSPDSVICPGKTVTFQNTSIGRGLNYFWQFGDGNASTDESPSYTYNLSGVYRPVLTATDINGCIDSFSLRSLLVDLPTASFDMSDSFSSCPPLLVDFKNESNAYVSLLWDFGNGNSSTLSSPSHLYTDPGVYTVKLIAAGSGGCADSINKVINIKGPSGTFSYPKQTICYPDSVQFSATVINTELITWDFSDGETESTANTNTSHLYDVGSYVPRMILDDGKGCRISVRGKDTIRVVSITANAVVFGNPACDSATVFFESLSVSQDPIIAYWWSFGDGNFDDTIKTSHNYKQPGSYPVSLQVETNSGCKDTFYLPANVVVIPSPDLSMIGPDAICAGTGAAFQVINLVSDTSAFTYTWTGLSVPNNQADTTGTIIFNTPGTYDFKVVAVNSSGCVDSAAKQLVVQPAPNVKTIPDTALCQNSSYQLNATGAIAYQWTGADLSCVNCSSPVLTVNQSGYYYVSGTDDLGCGSSDTVYVRAIEPHTINVGAGDTVCVGSTITLKADGANTYQWTPPAYLDNPNADKPVYTASVAGEYRYMVTGYGEKNCFKDSDFVSVKAYPTPKMNIVGDDELILKIGNTVKLETQNSADITNWQWQPAAGLSNPNIPNPIVSAKESTPYVCIASNGGGCVVRDEVFVRVVCGNSNIFLPNTFSPNNDGMNETFYVRGTGLFAVKSFRVFNRWGQLVFERKGASPNNATEGWNGAYNNKVQMSDVYVYIVEVQCDNGVVIPIKGNVTLLR